MAWLQVGSGQRQALLENGLPLQANAKQEPEEDFGACTSESPKHGMLCQKRLRRHFHTHAYRDGVILETWDDENPWFEAGIRKVR